MAQSIAKCSYGRYSLSGLGGHCGGHGGHFSWHGGHCGGHGGHFGGHCGGHCRDCVCTDWH